jgi:hypothetical protein
MSIQVQNQWHNLFCVPHIRSAIFQYLYHSDVEIYGKIEDNWGTPIQDASFVDFNEDAFNFCKAANINIYKEKRKLLNALHKEKQKIHPKAVTAREIYYGFRDKFQGGRAMSDADKAKYDEAEAKYYATRNEAEEIDLMTWAKYLNFNESYNKEYEPDYLFTENSDLGGWFPANKL